MPQLVPRDGRHDRAKLWLQSALGLVERHERTPSLPHATFDGVFARQVEQASSQRDGALDARHLDTEVPRESARRPRMTAFVACAPRCRPKESARRAMRCELATQQSKSIHARCFQPCRVRQMATQTVTWSLRRSAQPRRASALAGKRPHDAQHLVGRLWHASDDVSRGDVATSRSAPARVDGRAAHRNGLGDGRLVTVVGAR